MENNPIFLVVGKSIHAPGGYAAVARTIKQTLGKRVHVISSTRRGSVLPLLPLLSIQFAVRIMYIMRVLHVKQANIWGIGPWGLAGVFVKWFYPNTKLTTSYFTTIRHEWRYDGLEDYSFDIKMKYFCIALTSHLYAVFDYMTLRASDQVIVQYKSTKRILENEFS